MRHFGTVKTFNNLTGTGFISQEKGGDLLPFRQIDVQRQRSDKVQECQRLSYEIEYDDQGELEAKDLRFA
ncbi:cold-shock protein [Erythrobacter sp. W53]|uniref:cold-shock protein n=1 Tax=Erythrobacter sp. W53 TaxID=3425947 RepID=UPI003D766915